MSDLRIGIILGSTRPGRKGDQVAKWVLEQASKRDSATYELVDLSDFNLPHLDEAIPSSQGIYANEHTKVWSAKIASLDGFIFVTPEYNHSYSPALKNAIDFLHLEWWRKPVGFVSYGGVSAGTRGVVALEPVVIGVGMVRTGANVELPFGGAQVADGVFTPQEKESAILLKELAELDRLADALRPLQNR